MRRILLASMLGIATLPTSGLALTGDVRPVTDGRYLSAVGSIARESGVMECGATVVAPGWALTAAHCVTGRTITAFQSLGDTRHYRTTDTIVAPSGEDLALVGVPGITGNTLPVTDACMSGGTSVRIVSVGHDAGERRTATPAQIDADIFGCDYRVPELRENVITWAQNAVVCGGDSGSPVIAQTPAGQRVVGVTTRRTPNAGSQCSLRHVGKRMFTAAYMTRIGTNAEWITDVTARPPTALSITATLRSDSWADIITINPEWSGWQLRLTPVSGGEAYSAVVNRGDIVIPTRLHHGTWSVQVWHPDFRTAPAPATITSRGPRVVIDDIVKTRRTVRIYAHGVAGAGLSVWVRARAGRTPYTRRVIVRPGITRVRLPRAVRSRVGIEERRASGSLVVRYASPVRPPNLLGATAAPLPAFSGAQESTPEPAPIPPSGSPLITPAAA